MHRDHLANTALTRGCLREDSKLSMLMSSESSASPPASGPSESSRARASPTHPPTGILRPLWTCPPAAVEPGLTCGSFVPVSTRVISADSGAGSAAVGAVLLPAGANPSTAAASGSVTPYRNWVGVLGRNTGVG